MATVTDLIRLYGSGLHVEVPDFDGQVVAGHHVASTVAELYIRDGWDDFRKEWAIVWILWLLKHFEKKKKDACHYCTPTTINSINRLQFLFCDFIVYHPISLDATCNRHTHSKFNSSPLCTQAPWNRLTFGMLVTQRWRPHVTQTDGALATAVHKSVTLVGVKLCCCDHLR